MGCMRNLQNMVDHTDSGTLVTATKSLGSNLIFCLIPMPRNPGLIDLKCTWASGNLKSITGDSNGQLSLKTTGLIDAFEPYV